jgi:hypothetical protein
MSPPQEGWRGPDKHLSLALSSKRKEKKNPLPLKRSKNPKPPNSLKEPQIAEGHRGRWGDIVGQFKTVC